MNFDLLTLTAEAAKQPKGGLGSLLPMIAIYAVLFGALYFFMIRPQKKKQKEEKKMRENLQVGDEVVTIGGIYGRVVSLKEDTMVIESLTDRSKMTIARWALQSNLTVHDDTPTK
jgi:preprotein translocase subunit YajC